MCNNHTHSPYKIVQNDEDGSEIEFEGWIQLGNPVRERDQGFNGKCQRMCSMNSPNIHLQQNDNCCSSHEVGHVLGEHTCKSSCNHSCAHNLNSVNLIRRSGRCIDCSGKNHGFGRQLRNENEIYYVNNRQHHPTVLVQKPQTVVVRNKSRPPIVVQQPPPNVIVKNDPPQPIYVQNCPPNIMVKNTEPPVYRNFQTFQPNVQVDRGTQDEMIKRQSTCGISRTNQTFPTTHKRNHCIYHCKNPCQLN